MTLKWGWLIAVIGVLMAWSAEIGHAKQCSGVAFPDQAQVNGSTLTLNGVGLRQATMLKVNVYVAGLYVAQPSTDPAAILESPAPKELVLHFVRNVGASDLRKAWDEGFAANAKDQLPALKERVDTLKGWMADMKSGERITFVHVPGAGIKVDVGGATRGTVKGDDFARAFLSIWLGAHPPNPDLKTGLLGGACG
jgi:long-chain acyl-CoA synthetase